MERCQAYPDMKGHTLRWYEGRVMAEGLNALEQFELQLGVVLFRLLELMAGCVG